jgi:hypothetical protein
MAFHNFFIMTLRAMDTPPILIRLIQFGKEGILLLLLFLAGRIAWNAWRARAMPHLLPLDIVVAAFAALACIYFVLSDTIIPSEANLSQRFLSFRIALLLPGLYLFGRLFWSRKRQDLVWVAQALLGSAAAVGLFGLWELWFVPTPTWFGWGVNLLSSWLGFAYGGPKGLPENFFQATASGLLLRRMVSTYVSPLGLAYTGLLIVPMGVAMITLVRKEWGLPAWFRWATFALLVVGILFSVTRGALVSLVFEMGVLFVLFRGWRLLATTTIVILGTIFVLFEYVNFGPLVTYGLDEARPPVGYALMQNVGRGVGILPSQAKDASTSSNNTKGTPQPGNTTQTGELIGRTLTAEDPSARGHLDALRHGIDYAIKHPLGTGLGSAVPRYGTTKGPGESALLNILGEMGVVGGLLYVLMYALGLWYGLRAHWKAKSDRLLDAFPLVAVAGGLALLPISLTSTIWGNFSVTFLLWWCIGLSATIAAQSGAGRNDNGAPAAAEAS